jgi:hypothetical protein
MSYFETHIAPHLTAANEFAYRVAREVRRMPARPSWYTIAEDELARAERETEQLLATIRAARAEFARKPVEKSRAA